jgi:glutamine synthetase
MTAEERNARGITALPTSLQEAIQIAEGSDLLNKALGPAVMESFLRNKRIEWLEYARTVTDFEVTRYLRLL